MTSGNAADGELRAAMGLSEIRGLGPARLRKLIDRLGSARGVLRHGSADESLRPELRQRLRRCRPASAQRIGALKARGIRLVSYRAPGYPERLLHLHDPPIVLYLNGPLALAERGAVAVVGTRRATAYGRTAAEDIVRELVADGWTIVSGLASGIDAAAHRAALDANGSTVAVLGSGFDYEFPAVNRPLYRRIRRVGVLVSEHPPATPPAPGLFPSRNRIIAALSDAVVVVQAGKRSGALITAGHGLDLGREVFAVPGPVSLEASAGVHELLRDGAGLATNGADVTEALHGCVAMRWEEPGRGAGREADPTDSRNAVHPIETGVREAALLEALSRGSALPDELRGLLSVSISEILATLSALELTGAVRRQPGGRYERTRTRAAGV